MYPSTSAPTGQPSLQGATRSWKAGWMYFQDPVLLISVVMWLMATGSVDGVRPRPASTRRIESGMGHLLRHQHRLRGFTGRLFVRVRVYRHFLAQRLTD